MAQAFKLGKDEPHPMGPFAAFDKFIGDLVIDVSLGVQEANKVSISQRNLQVVAANRDLAANSSRQVVAAFRHAGRNNEGVRSRVCSFDLDNHLHLHGAV
jgi:hypothetical protein